ncbi:MAG: amidohydrolase family protein [Phycisphaerales bacterium]|nr:amidohydrolase [Phycisphaerae bacterium]NNF42934.1 amidohydrolase family protein [Phycisphaerales bacterium]NNM27479.1 amidohydrolase family protein [Phycisphaerales bacterium]
MSTPTSTSRSSSVRPANRLGLDYDAEATRLGPPVTPIIDVHCHLNGLEAIGLYRRAAERYGVSLAYSMTKLEEVEPIRAALDGRVRFIAVPNYWSTDDRRHHMGTGYPERIEAYHRLGARIVKFWAAPRARDYAVEMGDPDFMRLDAPHRIDAMEAARALGMIFMTHVADPDTWFQTKYRDANAYGTKASQYEPFEMLLDRFDQPWIGAHLGGWPEDLEFLTGLLDRHSNLYLDTSATKWMVRELSRHSREELIAFLRRFQGRILFGSDVVTADEHLAAGDDDQEMYAKASNENDAYDLYASRFFALRTLYETDADGPSPIADPDLAMVDPERYDPTDAPPLRGKQLPADLLRSLYHDAAHTLLEPLFAGA